MKGSEAIVDQLIKHGNNITFGYPGGVLIPLFDAFLERSNEIKNVLVRHEQAAAHAAEAYGKVLGKAGVCIGTSGPGASNLTTGIMNAYMDSSPLIALGGQVASNLIGNDAFQETDMIGITMPITKHNFQLRSADDAIPVMKKAYKIALEGRPGPVYIDMPVDTLKGEIKNTNIKDVKIEGFQPNLKSNPVQIKKAAELIMKAERPLLLIGGGALISNASKEINELAELTKIPVATTMMGKGVFDERNPIALGVVGMHGRKIANYAMVNTDLLIAIGVRFSDRITGNLSSYLEKGKLIHIDIDPAEIGKNVKATIPIVGDAKDAVKQLVAILKKMKIKADRPYSQKMMEFKNVCDKCFKPETGNFINPRQIIDALNKELKEDDIVTTGVGQHQMFAMHYLKRSKPRTYISSGGAGTMGTGLPYAMGAKVAAPDKRVVCLDGDGSFQMNIQELGTLSEEGINLTAIIFNNSYLGMVRQWLEIFFNKRYSQVHLGKGPNFAKIAEGYGLEGIRIEKESELQEAIRRALKNDVTTIIDVKVEEESNILPMLPPGGHLKEAFGACIKAPGEFF